MRILRALVIASLVGCASSSRPIARNTAPVSAPAPAPAAPPAPAAVPTCHDLAVHSYNVAVQDAAPDDKQNLEQAHDKILEMAQADCEKKHFSAEVTRCLMDAPDTAGFKACGEKFGLDK